MSAHNPILTTSPQNTTNKGNNYLSSKSRDFLERQGFDTTKDINQSIQPNYQELYSRTGQAPLLCINLKYFPYTPFIAALINQKLDILNELINRPQIVVLPTTTNLYRDHQFFNDVVIGFLKEIERQYKAFSPKQAQTFETKFYTFLEKFIQAYKSKDNENQIGYRFIECVGEFNYQRFLNHLEEFSKQNDDHLRDQSTKELTHAILSSFEFSSSTDSGLDRISGGILCNTDHAFLYAIRNSHIKCLEMMIAHGISPIQKFVIERKGRVKIVTPKQYAVLEGTPKSIVFLARKEKQLGLFDVDAFHIWNDPTSKPSQSETAEFLIAIQQMSVFVHNTKKPEPEILHSRQEFAQAISSFNPTSGTISISDFTRIFGEMDNKKAKEKQDTEEGIGVDIVSIVSNDKFQVDMLKASTLTLVKFGYTTFFDTLTSNPLSQAITYLEEIRAPLSTILYPGVEPQPSSSESFTSSRIHPSFSSTNPASSSICPSSLVAPSSLVTTSSSSSASQSASLSQAKPSNALLIHEYSRLQRMAKIFAFYATFDIQCHPTTGQLSLMDTSWVGLKIQEAQLDNPNPKRDEQRKKEQYKALMTEKMNRLMLNLRITFNMNPEFTLSLSFQRLPDTALEKIGSYLFKSSDNTSHQTRTEVSKYLLLAFSNKKLADLTKKRAVPMLVSPSPLVSAPMEQDDKSNIADGKKANNASSANTSSSSTKPTRKSKKKHTK